MLEVKAPASLLSDSIAGILASLQALVVFDPVALGDSAAAGGCCAICCAPHLPYYIILFGIYQMVDATAVLESARRVG